MKKITLPKLMRWIAVLIFIIGAGLGYDAGDKQVVLDGQVIAKLNCVAAADVPRPGFIEGLYRILMNWRHLR